MREAETESHEGKSKNESLWPIFEINHKRSRFIYDLKKEKRKKELYEFLYVKFDFLCLFPLHFYIEDEKTKTRINIYLQKLIEFKTIPGSFLECREAINCVKEQLAIYQCSFNEWNLKNTHPRIVTTKNTKSPKIWLVAHIDVVGAKDSLFGATITQDKLIGRGAYDMKCVLALYIKLFKELGGRGEVHGKLQIVFHKSVPSFVGFVYII